MQGFANQEFSQHGTQGRLTIPTARKGGGTTPLEMNIVTLVGGILPFANEQGPSVS